MLPIQMGGCVSVSSCYRYPPALGGWTGHERKGGTRRHRHNVHVVFFKSRQVYLTAGRCIHVYSNQ
jgi:hypothetical protein